MKEYDKQVLTVDGATKLEIEATPKQSANTLFRFFKDIGFMLKSIENAALFPRYYPETIDYLDIGQNNVAYPMICFCDINLHKMADHISLYGSYGIAFSKEWGIRNGIQPIQYVNTSSPLRNDFSKAFKNALVCEYEDPAHNFLLTQMYYLKPIKGTMQREKQDIPRIFTDECEWRYIPDLKTLELPQVVNERDIHSINTLNKTLERHSEAWLKYDYQDIKYIIIASEEDYDTLSKELYALNIDDEIRYKLFSKIVIWENMKGDF